MSRNMNPKYYQGLHKNDMRKQKKYIRDSRRLYKAGIYAVRPVPPSYKHKASKHVLDFRRIYGISIKNTKSVTKSTGVSASKQRKILSKGRGAYFSSGSRPGQTPSSWAYARLASALLGRAACHSDQHILAPLACTALRARSLLPKEK